MRRIAAVMTTMCASLAACFIKPDRPGGEATVDGGTAPADASDADASTSPVGCIMDSFENTALAPCGGWGSAMTSGAAQLQRVAGRLVVRSNGSAGAAECRTAVRDLADGVLVEIPQNISASGGRMGVELVFAGGASAGVTISGTGSGSGNVEAHAGPVFVTEPYQGPSTQRWWRIVPGSSNGILIETANTDAPASWDNVYAGGAPGAFTAVELRLWSELPQTGVVTTGMFDNLTTCL